MKKKNYVVRIVATCDVLVIGAKSESEAFDFAHDCASLGDAQFIEASIASQPKTAHELEAARRHADTVAEDEE
jgi:hypothetical protein